MKCGLIIGLMFVAALAAGGGVCQAQQSGQSPAVSGTGVDDHRVGIADQGETLARQFCVACHVFPEPELLNRRSWNFVLTYMGMYLGIDDLRYLQEGTDFEKEVINNRLFIMNNLSLIPAAPLIEKEEWDTLRNFYIKNSGEASLPQEEMSGVEDNIDWLVAKPSSYDMKSAINTLVVIDEDRREVLLGDMFSSKLVSLDQDLAVLSETAIPRNIVFVGAEASEGGLDLLSIGDLGGTEPGKYLGAIFYVKRFGKKYFPQGPVLRGLYRPSSMAYGDLTGDGEEEIVVSNFGIERGNVAIYQSGVSGSEYNSKPAKVLLEDTGAVAANVYDFDGDGRMDVAALTSNEKENFSLFLNRGGLEFERKTVLEWHPAFGSVGFEIVDFNKDGIVDIIIVNGDNSDSDPYNTLKPYHGVRIFLGDGDLNFTEAYFYPMYGAYGVEVHDFDLDGDLDIAVNALYPDFDAKEPLHFLVLEQTGSLIFEAKTHPDSRKGRWLSMDAGDIDGDGDIDIVLGAGYISTGLVFDKLELLKKMTKEGPPLLFLENRTVE